MLSPIAESPQKERAAEQDEEEGLTTVTTTVRARAQHKYKVQANDKDEDENEKEEEEEERLLNVYSTGRWSRLETVTRGREGGGDGGADSCVHVPSVFFN